MDKYKLGEMEQRFAHMIWAHAPIQTRELIVLCAQAFDWKRTTTYTMLKRLCERGIFKNDSGKVIVLIEKDDFFAEKGQAFLEETFEGSLPKFITAFTQRKKLSSKEVQEIQELINAYHED